MTLAQLITALTELRDSGVPGETEVLSEDIPFQIFQIHGVHVFLYFNDQPFVVLSREQREAINDQATR